MKAEFVAISLLKPHERNYRSHPEDQLAHIVRSIEEHGFYRNVVTARDWTILAGHGVVQAAGKLGLKEVPVIKLDLDPGEPRALKVLTSDNEIGNLSENDDRALTEMLKEIMESGESLLGTGFDEENLAAMLLVTRPSSEMASIDESREWVGLPVYEEQKKPIKATVSFDSEEDRDKFLKLIGVNIIHKRVGEVVSIWWPERPKEDLKSVRFSGDAEA